MTSSATYTSSGYIRAHEETPESEPQKKGTREWAIGSHAGVGPCSPCRFRPKRCRMPSYSMKYSAVPRVSRTDQESDRKGRNHGPPTNVKSKAIVQAKETAVAHNVPYSLHRSRRFHKRYALAFSDGVLQLPPNLGNASGSLSDEVK